VNGMKNNARPFQLWWKMPGSGIDEIWTLDADDVGATVFHFSPFDRSQNAPSLQLRGTKRPAAAPESGTIKLHSSPEKSGANRHVHMQAVDAALKSIERGDLDKVVLSRSEFWETDIDPESLFRSKCQIYPDSLVYLFAHSASGVWLGASPELLLRRSSNRFETVSLAGTKSDLSAQWTEKEYREQEMVTDFITERLKSAGARNVFHQVPKDRAYGGIKHLESQIEFSSNDHEMTWLNELHPTPAVGGEPREEALRFIAKYERQPRGYYTGFLGWSEKEEASYFVNLRCMQCFADGFRLFAGGGIVSGSDANEEWEETRVKIDTIRSKLNR
jgi:isochorismate synthase